MKTSVFFSVSVRLIFAMMIIPGFVSTVFSKTPSKNPFLDQVPGYLTGVVTSAATGTPVIGAKITAGSSTGYSTGPNGAYMVNVYPLGTFSAVCTKPGFDNTTAGPFTFTPNNTITQNFSLSENVNPPNKITATLNAGHTAVNLSWNVPNGNYELLYDDGIQDAFQIWTFAGSYNAVKFTTLSYPCTLTGGKINIGTQDSYQAGSNPLVPFQFLIFDASGTGGSPGSQVAGPFDFTPTSYGWNDFTFSSPVTITDESFYIVQVQGGNSPNAAGIAIDNTTNQTRSFMRNMPSPTWVNATGNFMMRAQLYGPGGPFPSMMLSLSGDSTVVNDPPANMDQAGSVISYQVWRLLQGQEGTPANWSSIATTPVPNTVDYSWPSLACNPFRWAVKTQYTGNRWSAPAFSNVIGKCWTSEVTVNAALTCAGASPIYTSVKLQNTMYPDSVYLATLGNNGICTFPHVWNGTYTLTVSKFGYTTYAQTPISILGNTTLNVILLQIKTPPANLQINNHSLVAQWNSPHLTSTLFSEDWTSGSFTTNGWVTTGGTNWGISSTLGNPAPSAVFKFDPQAFFYHQFLTSKDINGQHSPLLTLKYDLSLNNNLTANTNFLSVEIWNGSSWDNLKTYTNMVSFPLTSETLDISAYTHNTFKIRFHTYGFDSYDINWWLLDNISVVAGNTIPDPCILGYIFYVDNNAMAVVTDTTYAIPPAICSYGQTLMCCVRAMYGSGYSDLLCNNVVSHYLCPPTNLIGTDNGADAYLTWTKPVCGGGLIGYKIYRSQGGPGGPWLLIKYVPGENTLNTSDIGLSAGEWWYRVTAFYDISSYGFPGSFDESFYEGPEPVYILVIPDNRILQNKTIANGMTECYDATQVITVAGNNTSYTVLNDGSVTMIAGQEIDFLPTTTVQPGGYLHGSITGNGTYCGSKSPSLVSIPETDPKNPDNGKSSFFKVYPNPTRGNFMLEMDDSRVFNNTRVEIYDMMGEMVLVKTITGEKKSRFSIAGMPAGVYFVRVVADGMFGSAKIMRQ